MQIREMGKAVHLSVCINSARHAQEKGARVASSTEGKPEQKDAEKKKEGTNFRNAMIAATPASPVGQGRGLLDPPWPSSLSALIHDDLLAAFFPETCTRLLVPQHPCATAALPVTPSGRAARDGSHAGTVPGREKTTLQQQHHPRKTQSRSPISASQTPRT